MAKNKVKASLDFDDNGDLKKIEKKAKAAGKGLEKGAKGAHSMDRRLRGAAGMSSNASKNFSKMSQGISGGLVPAYATLAASLFAIDAAFQALKRASDLRVQQEGMMAYAANSGIALQSISRELQAATGYQLDFKEAAESTSIAIAGGFSADQVIQIGKAAKTASIALGRDFADSYQRLLKGITKAEPELLDELGIILRLERATKIYGAAIGKNAKDLTAYERQQAVFNEVIGQTAEKYSMVGDAVPVSVMGQLGARFTDLTDSFLKGIVPIAEFFGKILVVSTTAAIAALGVFAASILKNVLPSAEAMRKKFQEAAIARQAAFSDVKGSGGRFMEGMRGIGSSRGIKSSAKNLATGSLGDVKSAGLKNLRKGGNLTGVQKGGLKNALRQAEAQFSTHNKVVSGMFKGKDARVLQSLRLTLTAMDGGWKGFVAKTKLGVMQIVTTFKIGTTALKAIWKTTTAIMSAAAAKMGRAMNAALGIIGWIGMIFMAKDAIIGMWESLDKILLAIGQTMIKVGKWIGKIAPRMGKMLEGWGEGVVEKNKEGSERNLKKQATRDRRVATNKGKGYGEGLAETTKDITKMQESWVGMAKVNDQFNQLDATANAIASSGILGKLDQGISILTSDQAAWSEELKATASKDLTTFLNKMGELDGRYSDQATALAALDPKSKTYIEDLKKIRNGIIKVNNEFGTHVQAGKDFNTTFEGLSKRWAEAGVKSSPYSKLAIDLKAMKTAAGEFKDQFDPVVEEEINGKMVKTYDKRLEALRLIYGDEILTSILTVQDAEKKLTETYDDQIEALKEIQGLQLAQQSRDLERAGLVLGTSRVGAQRGLELTAEDKRGAADKAKKVFEMGDLERKSRLVGLKGDELLIEQQLQSLGEGSITLMEKQATVAEELAGGMTQLKMAGKQAFEDGLTKGIEGLIMGTMSLKEAFASMAKGIIASLAQVLAKQMAVKMMGSLIGREGGIFTQRGDGGYKSFRDGGIASGSSGRGYQATLHGTEAVVPLGNDRSIPVKMQGGAMNTNNTNVVVNVEGGQASSDVSGESQASALGNLIAATIEERLVNESRPGGLLARGGGG